MNEYIQKWRRYFTRESLLSEIPRVQKDALVTNPDGSVVFRLDGIETPASWSDRAVRVAAQKYFLKEGAQSRDGRFERSVFEMVYGVAHTIAQSGFDQGYFATADDAFVFEEELAHLLIHQYGAFNSPVWFNVRLGHMYGVRGSGGNWAWNRETGEYTTTPDSYMRPQISACFIQEVNDNLVEDDGIWELWKKEARLFKLGSGSGVNVSRIREKDAPLTAGGTASGVMSFLPAGDAGAGGVKSGGTTRRAARMVCMDVDHPEIEAFVGWKEREEWKAQVLIAAGCTGGMEGEAYTTVSGQNANNSVRVTDEFMRAVEDDKPWDLTGRLTGKTVKTLRAKALWASIAQAAWVCGCPGVQYDTTINAWHTTPNAGRIRASNPCSEYMHLDNSACNLASLRLTKFMREDGTFNVEDYRAAVRTFTVAMDILVDLGSYPSKEIARGAHRYRQLGLGYADLGALLMLKGVSYDSDAGRAFAAGLTSLMTAEAYFTSGCLAEAHGPFEGYAADKDGMLGVLAKHQQAHRYLQASSAHLFPVGDQEILTAGAAAWHEARSQATEHGVRNAQATVLAPTGTIGFLMDCETTGVEPLLGHVQYKKLAGGGTVTLVNRLVRRALERLGYSGSILDAIVSHVEATGGFSGSALRPEHLPVFDTAIPCGVDGRYLTVDAHLEMMAAVQPFLSGAISKTVNMPRGTTPEDVAATYMKGWKLGLKAVAIYRDGSKESQPVSTKQGEDKMAVAQAGAEKIDEILPRVPPMLESPTFKHTQRKLPKERRGITWALKLDDHKIYIRSGEYDDGTLGEIFVDIAKEGSTLGGLYGMWAKAVSLGLQYGVPLAEFIETFIHTKFEPNGGVKNHPTIKRSTSLVDLTMRVLGVKYAGRKDLQHVQEDALEFGEIPPTHLDAAAYAAPAKSYVSDAPLCPICGTLTQRNGACHRCPQCGESLGCS